MWAIFTNDDAGVALAREAVEGFRTVVRWLDSLGLQGTFFWIPEPPQWPQAQQNWRETLEWAVARGHDFQLHGLSHDTCLEFGVPQESTRRANPQPFEEYELHHAYWEREHQAERLRAKLERGIAHYQAIFGCPPLVFRAPCFGVCPGMYEALHAVGLRLSSSRGINPTATAYALGALPADTAFDDLWQPDFPCRPWLEPPGILEVPCMEDLCLGGVTAETYDSRLALVKAELEHFLAEADEESVLVIGSHYNAMIRTWAYTRPLLEEMLEWLAQQGVMDWITFAQYAEIIEGEQ